MNLKSAVEKNWSCEAQQYSENVEVRVGIQFTESMDFIN